MFCQFKFAFSTFTAFFLPLAGSVTSAETPLIVSKTQIFADDVLIAAKKNVVRRIHPCRKLNRPVVEPEYPWEGNRIYSGSVHYDKEKNCFAMWYASYPPKARKHLVNYATSSDGVHWIKPKLGLYSFQGSKENNIVWEKLGSHSVIFDPADPIPEHRYKMAGKHGGFFVLCSPDGIHWRKFQSKPLFPLKGDTNTWTRSPYSGEFMAFHKEDLEIRGHKRRSVMLSYSKDLHHWSKPELVLTADEIDDAWAKGSIQCTQIYRMSAFPYAGQFLGIANVFRRTERLSSTVSNQSADEGPIHGQLVHSRDGHTWSRFEDRTPIIPNGPDEYDAGCILFTTNMPVIHNDEIWIYYTAINTGHGGALPKKRITIGRASWRRDRFVSLDANEQQGIVETVPMKLSGGCLLVNADASEGRLRVEILDEDGKPLPGYGAQESIPIETDALKCSIRWKDRVNLPTERPVRLRFLLQNAKLYSYTVR